MGTLKAEGIVLRHANYRDHDRMLLLLTPEHGLVDALCRGCRRPKSPLLPAGQCFSRGEYMLFKNQNRYTVTACGLLSIHYPLWGEPYRLTCASYMAGLCRVAAQPGEPASQLYTLLLWGLSRLCGTEAEAPLRAITSAFLLRYADVTGYRPRLSHCANCARAIALGSHEHSPCWDVRAGGLVCGDCAGKDVMRLTGDQVIWMRDVLARSLEALSSSLPTASAMANPPLSPPAAEKELFVALKRYVEARLETTLKVSKLLP